MTSGVGGARLLVVTACLAALLTSCGAVGTSPLAAPATPVAGPMPPPPTREVPSPTGSSAVSPTTPAPAGATTAAPTVDSRLTTGVSLGVDRIDWPTTLAGARAVLAGLPGQLGGVRREVYFNSGEGEDPPVRDAGASYGERSTVTVSEAYRSTDKLDPHHAWGSANNLLSANFGLGLGCARGSYRGTAPRPTNPYGGPAVTDRALTDPVWFSCRVSGAEGDESYRGHAVGWTSGKTAWLVVTPDRRTSAVVVTALHAALP
jgi:hypothetical protein